MGKNDILTDGQTGTATIVNVVEFPEALEQANRFLLPTKKDFPLSIELSSGLPSNGKPLQAIDVIVAGHVSESESGSQNEGRPFQADARTLSQFWPASHNEVGRGVFGVTYNRMCAAFS